LGPRWGFETGFRLGSLTGLRSAPRSGVLWALQREPQKGLPLGKWLELLKARCWASNSGQELELRWGLRTAYGSVSS